MFSALAAQAGDGSTRESVQNIATTNDQIVLALIAIVATSVAALVYVIRNNRYGRVAAEQATAANEAVNNVGEGKHKLYHMVEATYEDVAELKEQQKQFDSHGWETLPPDLGSAVALTQTIRTLQNQHDRLHEKLDTIISELREHVVWEMNAKYGLHGDED